MFPTLGPGPTGPPVPPPQPPPNFDEFKTPAPTFAPVNLTNGSIVLARDLSDNWRILNLTGETPNGTWMGDVLENVTVMARVNESTTWWKWPEKKAHYPHVYTSEEYMRNTPPPPTVTPEPLPNLYLPTANYEQGEWEFGNATLATTTPPEGWTKPPHMFVLSAGEWPLKWDKVVFGGPGPSPAPAAGVVEVPPY